MSLITLSSLERITAPRLADMLLRQAGHTGAGAGSGAGEGEGGAQKREGDAAARPDVVVVDVRDDGGHIRGSLHFASHSLDATMPTLRRRLEGRGAVVFHCALSQQRGPSAALRYLREVEGAAAAGQGQGQGQKVYVLDRGFTGWQELYGEDERLTEGYRKEIWESGW